MFNSPVFSLLDKGYKLLLEHEYFVCDHNLVVQTKNIFENINLWILLEHLVKTNYYYVAINNEADWGKVASCLSIDLKKII